MLGDYEIAAAADTDEPPVTRSLALAFMGREQDSIAALRDLARRGYQGMERSAVAAMLAALENRREGILAAISEFPHENFRDPEGLFLVAFSLARVGEVDLAFEWLERVVRGGFWCPQGIAGHPWLENVRGDRRYAELLAFAEDRHREAVRVYEESGGPRLLGVPGR
jgi:hypothetical protein